MAMDRVIEHLAATKVGEFLALCGVMGRRNDESIRRSIHNLVELGTVHTPPPRYCYVLILHSVRTARCQQASHEKLVDPKSPPRSKDRRTPAEATSRPSPPSESKGTERNYPASGEVATERPKQENGRQAFGAADHCGITTSINREWRTAAPSIVRFETLTARVEQPWKPDEQGTESAVTNSEFQSAHTQGASTLSSQITTPGTEARRPVDHPRLRGFPVGMVAGLDGSLRGRTRRRPCPAGFRHVRASGVRPPLCVGRTLGALPAHRKTPRTGMNQIDVREPSWVVMRFRPSPGRVRRSARSKRSPRYVESLGAGNRGSAAGSRQARPG